MSQRRDFEVAVLGAGVAGLVAALAVSRTERTVLVADRLPDASAPPRIDAIPARCLALLVELGIPPAAIGVDRLHETRSASWERASSDHQATPPMAHVERPTLEVALLDRLLRTGRVEVVMSRNAPQRAGALIGEGWRAARLIDATGRRALTAGARIAPERSWGSRFFWAERRGTTASSDFRLAGLSDGYAYRLGSAGKIGIGVVGRDLMKDDATALERRLYAGGAGWLLDGMPPLATLSPGATGVASVQWSRGTGGLRVGAAALARDALSSQGIASACSEALYAAAARGAADVALFLRRQSEQRLEHLASLDELIRRCRFAEEPAWAGYAAFVRMHRQATSRPILSVLRDGRLMAIRAPEKDASAVQEPALTGA